MTDPYVTQTKRKNIPFTPPDSRPSKPRWMVFLQVLIVMMTLIFILLVGYGVYLYWKLQDTTSQIGTADMVNAADRARVKPVSILILGTDYRKETKSANTDVIMIATLNPKSKSATLVSVPRDTYMDPQGLRPNKANSFYAAYLYSSSFDSAPDGKEARQLYAMDNIKEVFGRYVDMNIDYVSIVDFKTFEDIIDAFGGLTIDVDQDMCHNDRADGTNINLKAGIQQLNGKQTLDFVRYRKSMNCRPRTPGSSDFERNARQHQVISKLFEKLKSTEGVMKVGNILDAVGNNVKSDIPSQQIEDMLETYVTIDNTKIDFIHLEGNWDGQYVHISPEAVAAATTSLQNQLLPDGPPTIVQLDEPDMGTDEPVVPADGGS
jgi:LCP family protein required for cell wall assembly